MLRNSQNGVFIINKINFIGNTLKLLYELFQL